MGITAIEQGVSTASNTAVPVALCTMFANYVQEIGRSQGGIRLVTARGDIVLLETPKPVVTGKGENAEIVPFSSGSAMPLERIPEFDYQVADDERVVPTDLRIPIRGAMLDGTIQVFAWQRRIVLLFEEEFYQVSVLKVERPTYIDPTRLEETDMIRVHDA